MSYFKLLNYYNDLDKAKYKKYMNSKYRDSES